AIGLAIASYEWMAALTLLIVGKYFLPIFIEKGLYTIPQFIEKRFSTQLKTILALFWLALFVFVNLTAVLFLGAKALDTIMGNGDGSLFMISIIGLGLFAASYSLWGGLSAVAWTDVVQVVLLIIGGAITSIIGLQQLTPDGGILDGLNHLVTVAPEKFSMIISKGEIITPDGKDAWWDLPGIAVLVGGMWVANLYYWGFNQYIIQRTFAAQSLKEAQKGIAFAAFLKMILPFIVVLPGIIAFVLIASPEGVLIPDMLDPSFKRPDGSIINDNAAPWLIQKYVPTGIKGLVLAALAAAIVSSLASMLNSTATIFTMDIYKPIINKLATEKQMVNVGRLSAGIALIIAIFIAPMLGNLGQAFQFIQEYTGIVSPGILAVFVTGLFWKKTKNKSAIFGVIASIPIAMFFKVGPNGWSDSPIFVILPFMHQMMITCLASIAVIVIASEIEGKGQPDEKQIILKPGIFKTSESFNISSAIILLILAFIYTIFW
ncbi:MAG: sodium/solute symporter, partial [Saprospiraceae bacterium]|nr:sodium/solute symporter [Saprospiraceae bacterium]